MKIYLDHNLIVYLRGSTSEELGQKVKELKEGGNEFIFSPAHLEEIAVSFKSHGVCEETIDRDIDFLTDLCGKNSLRPSTRESVVYKTEYPRDCFERVIEYYTFNSLAEGIDEIVISDAHENPIGDPKEMNNIEPCDVFNHFHYRECLLFFLRNSGLINQSETIKYLQAQPHEDIKNKFFILEYAVNLSANWLEKMGYYREHRSKHRSRLHDVSHIIYGKYADVLVSNDAKFLKKAKAIYSFLGIATKVLTMNEFIQYEAAE